jgi:O-antigen/teichoic acid export membrane protein
MMLKQKAIRGFIWVNISRYTSIILRFIGGIYLARQIDPIFFGQQGFMAAYIAILFAVVNLGTEYYTIRCNDEDLNTVIGTQITLRLGLITVIGFCILIFYFFRNLLQLDKIFIYLVILFLAQGLTDLMNLYAAVMYKKLQFNRLALIEITSISMAVFVACLCASRGGKIFALVLLVIVEQIIRSILNFFISDKKFYPRFDMNVAKKIINFGKHFFSMSVLTRINGKISDIAIGSFLGQITLGFYQRANTFLGFLHQVITNGFDTVAQPIFGKMRKDAERLKYGFDLISSLLVRIVIGACLFTAIILPAAIVLLYTEKWLPAVPIARYLLPFIIAQSINVFIQNTHFVVGEAPIVSRVRFIEFIILMILLFPLLHAFKVKGAAVALDISSVTGTFLFFLYLKPFIKYSARKIFMSPIIALTCGILGWLIFVMSSGKLSFSVIEQSIIGAVIFGIIYVTVLLLLEFSYLQNIIKIIRTKTV